jgi:transcriptional regulator with XRE-family HTH domain
MVFMHTVTNVEGLLKLMKTLQGDQTQKRYAEKLGVSAQYLNDVYNMRREPGKSILDSIGVTRAFVVSPETLNAAHTVSGGICGHEESSSKKASSKKHKGK